MSKKLSDMFKEYQKTPEVSKPVMTNVTPKPMGVPKRIIKDEKEDQFFEELAKTTEFKRFVYRVLYGKVHRTESRDGNLEEKVRLGLEAIRDPNFSNVIKEMKLKFKPSENNLIPSQINNK